MSAPVVLIPAYQPPDALADLVRELRRRSPGSPVVVVDDGSGVGVGGRYAVVLERVCRLGAEVVRHRVNRGKGQALKTGLAHVAAHHPGRAVVCADADGQHLAHDILAVGAAVAAGSGSREIVLGVRSFDGSQVPWRSRVGNVLARRALGRATRLDLVDTQTGLRAYPAGLIPWLLQVRGSRFEWEQRVLLEAAAADTTVRQLPIATVYLPGNTSSHFRPVRDSLRVMLPMVIFALSSAAAALLDVALLLVLHALTGQLLLSIVGARLASASVNFVTNRHVVFRGNRRVVPAALGYVVLAGLLLALNAALMHLFVLGWGWSLLAAKVVVEAVLWGASYQAQRRWVFGRREASPAQTSSASSSLTLASSRSARA